MSTDINFLCKESLFSFIENKYDNLKNDMGWDLLFCRYENMLSPQYPVAFFGINPGGGPCDTKAISVESECAYYNERWKGCKKGNAPLQQQMKHLYTMIGDELGVSYKQLMDGSLMTNYIPARSRNWHSLKGKNEWLEHARQIWGERVKQVHCKLYIAISKIVFDELDSHLTNQGFQMVENIDEQIGWGRVRYQIQRYERGDQVSLIVRLPHLSTYKIFSRPACQSAIDRIKIEIAKTIR
ncbi:hypothetical protein RI534_02800 [Aeromonas allosaccharophila]|uniref:hypothetical protein n=1 Tax=Aeromonas allosaccharophila TaxID=656 RepID=UPI00342017AB